MTILAYDEVMLREPALLLPAGRPVGAVKSALPGRTLFAHLFDAKRSHGLPFDVTNAAAALFTSQGTVVDITVPEITATFPTNAYRPGTGAWTLLVDIYLGDGVPYDYEYAGGGTYDTGFGFAVRHLNTSNTWTVLYGSAFLAPAGAAVLSSSTNYTFGFSRVAASSPIIECALNGVSYGTVDGTGYTCNITEWAFNTYDPGGLYGLRSGSVFKGCLWVDQPSSGARLADLTAYPSSWWVPL